MRTSVSAVLVFVASLVVGGKLVVAEARTSGLPNIVVIQADDQNPGMVEVAMPFVYEEIFEKGRSFSRYYVTTPQCCPSRISLLTGRYASDHGVLWNGGSVPDDLPTLVSSFRQLGYETAHLGKFTNSWSGEPRKEYDYWVAPLREHRNKEVNVTYNVNGRVVQETGHHLISLLSYFKEFVARTKKPFILFFNPFAPHAPGTPLPEHLTMFKDITLPKGESYLEEDLSDKPEWLKRYKAQPRRLKKLAERYRAQLRASRSLDYTVEQAVGFLREQGILDNTVIVYLSDNGIQYGEHGLIEKSVPYEESIRVPMAIRGKGISPGIDDRLAANIDVLPTLLQVVGASAPTDIPGINLLSQTRESVILEGGYKSHIKDQKRWVAVHSGDTVLIDTEGESREYYDLKKDPQQLTSGEIPLAGPLVVKLEEFLSHYNPYKHTVGEHR